jgi:hypothetical protein
VNLYILVGTIFFQDVSDVTFIVFHRVVRQRHFGVSFHAGSSLVYLPRTISPNERAILHFLRSKLLICVTNSDRYQW